MFYNEEFWKQKNTCKTGACGVSDLEINVACLSTRAVAFPFRTADNQSNVV